nr:unnamed protein product [Callosobruchus chinensis]
MGYCKSMLYTPQFCSRKGWLPI